MAAEPHEYPPLPFWQKAKAMLGCRCPRCGQGKIFASTFRMNDPCPVCGLVFERDEGYFLGAMYVSSLFSFVLMGGGYFLADWLFPTTNQFLLVMLVLGVYLLLVPAVFRYSRVIWMYWERWGCMTDLGAGAYEKNRIAESENEHQSNNRTN